jgi:hypothetical protein
MVNQRYRQKRQQPSESRSPARAWRSRNSGHLTDAIERPDVTSEIYIVRLTCWMSRGAGP